MCWRRWRHGLANVHPTFYLAGRNTVSPDLVAAEYSYIGPECLVGPKVELGAYAMLGPRVAIVGGDHRYDRLGVPIIFSGRPALEQTLIEADAWVGYGAILLAGVKVGRGAIVAAGAVVTRDVPPYEIHGGVPARRIGERFPETSDRDFHDRMLDASPRRGEYCPPLQISVRGRLPSRGRLVAITAIGGLVILELLLRLAGFGDPLLLQKDAEIGYLYQPNQHMERLGHMVAINAYHQRSGLVALHPAPGTIRILFLGDSVTFGTTLLDQTQTISELVKIRFERNTTNHVEVLNASAGSWGIGNQLAYLQRFGTMGARLVIVQIGSHDLLQRKSLSDGVGVDPAMPDKRPPSALSEVWQRYVQPRLTGPSSPRDSAIVDGPEAELQFTTNMDSLAEIIRFVRGCGATPVLLHTPNRNEVLEHRSHADGRYESWRRRFVALAEQERVPLLNLYELWQSDAMAPKYFRDHVHLTATGTCAVANTLCEFLHESGGQMLFDWTGPARSITAVHWPVP